jgi:hypothetical protein
MSICNQRFLRLFDPYFVAFFPRSRPSISFTSVTRNSRSSPFDCGRWDEWVPENRLLKFNEENLELQKKLLLTHAATSHGGSTSKASNKSTAGGGSASTRGRKEGTRGTKRAREDVRSFSILSLSRAFFGILITFVV